MTAPVGSAVRQELTDVAAIVRAELIEEAEFLGEEGRTASESLVDLLETTATYAGGVPVVVLETILDFARTIRALREADEKVDHERP